MSFILPTAESVTEEEKRAQKLASARRKLQTFRASRSSDHSAPPSASTSISLPSSTMPPFTQPSVMPLTTETSVNQFVFPMMRTPSKGKAKELEPESPTKPIAPPVSGHRHRRSESQAHRRQRSSIAISSGTPFGQGLSRPSVMGAFQLEIPKEIITTPATPLMNSPHIPASSDDEEDEEHTQVAARLSAFSFGAKSPASTFPPKRRQQQPLLPSQGLFAHDAGIPPSTSPLASPTSYTADLNRLSTPSSRPPSLLLTEPTPLHFGSPTSGPRSRNSFASSPSSPPTPARKRHSHTRSNSISLPNLKLGPARPTSLGIPSSPSYPSSPASPCSPSQGPSKSRLSGPINGQRLKFEPSGRGAEAEKDRQESRRKALEKLTGGPPRRSALEVEINEISLPDLDDEDSSSVASSNRPLSGTFGSGSGSNFFFTRPSSVNMSSLSASLSTSPSSVSAAPFSWSSPPAEEKSPEMRWQGFNFGQQKDVGKEEGLGFGTELSKVMAKRPSLNRQLSALAEVDESEEEERSLEALPEDVNDDMDEELDPTPAVEPTPSRLRELRLNSSASSTTPRQADTSSESIHSFSFPRASTASPAGSTSPTKSYGTIGRGRPKPLTGTNASASPAGGMSTPKNASTIRGRRRFAPGSGSRGSSISYKKDGSGSSSHDLSIGSGNIVSPPIMSPSALGSPRWSNPRNSQRPCPRPRTLVGLGIDSTGAGRVLNEVTETEEEQASPVPRWGSITMSDTEQAGSFARFEVPDGGRSSNEMSRSSFGDSAQWRDAHIELEMEREALKEDVEIWRTRCRELEEKLETERRESAVLRDRVRKLGDRLSSVSSVPTGRNPVETHTAESQLIAEMREQLFTLTSSLEQERRAKETALAQVTELQQQQQILRSHNYDDSEDDELLLTARPDEGSLFPANIPSPMITAPSPEPGSETPQPAASPDPNFARMKGWGFPRDVSSTTSTSDENTSKKNKRESFFGLSKAIRRISSAGEEEQEEIYQGGVDLPPFVVTEQHAEVIRPMTSGESYFPATNRAVSEPVHFGAKSSTPLRSTSASHLPTYNMSTSSPTAGISSSNQTENDMTPFSDEDLSSSRWKGFRPPYSAEEAPTVLERGKLDFRNGCKCCVGPVIEF
ncbi:hypothetical protein CI109_102866 [Kwoniella shandongensis]|uniref:Uncharacterized protein n=1 Tax=Kwoniella shandongensis TaxID=1734106 RepID=A0A5M6C7U7_9TREE|nr:uncharacterized protein CI109_000056 [Kwoniella shandongensis]KAA5531218.1 hypothetical protein CI109_000056 [Kwoniella shandongensis]